MRYLLPLIVTAWLALSGHPFGAAWVWTVAIALLHAYEEARGELWKYFGGLANLYWLRKVSAGVGFTLIVLPALLLQVTSAWLAFMGDRLDPFWLAVLIGARIGDAVFSHAVPYAADSKQENPGLPTAVIYAVDGLALALLWHVPLMTCARQSLEGLLIGVGFFVAVLPGLRLTKIILR